MHGIIGTDNVFRTNNDLSNVSTLPDVPSQFFMALIFFNFTFLTIIPTFHKLIGNDERIVAFMFRKTECPK